MQLNIASAYLPITTKTALTQFPFSLSLSVCPSWAYVTRVYAWRYRDFLTELSYANTVRRAIFLLCKNVISTTVLVCFSLLFFCCCCLFLHDTPHCVLTEWEYRKQTRRKHQNELFNFLWMFSSLWLLCLWEKFLHTLRFCCWRRCKLGSVSSIRPTDRPTDVFPTDVLFSFTQHCVAVTATLFSAFLTREPTQTHTHTRTAQEARKNNTQFLPPFSGGLEMIS